jgi:hypothetical protein
MPKPLDKTIRQLRERLLRAGVAPRHVRRYLAELTDHFADLTAQERNSGRSPLEAESAALLRLGTADALGDAMVKHPQFQAWSVRAPWAIFGLTPLALLAAAYFVACFILWSGWRIFLPAATTPFIRIHGGPVVYFGIGRELYFAAPVLVGWLIALTAARQRSNAPWPTLAFALLALAGASARVHATRPPSSLLGGQVSMSFAVHSSPDSLIRAVLIFSLAALPYFLWRLREGLSPVA